MQTYEITQLFIMSTDSTWLLGAILTRRARMRCALTAAALPAARTPHASCKTPRQFNVFYLKIKYLDTF